MVLMALSTVFPRLRSDEQPQQSRVQDGIQGTLGPLAQALNATPIMGSAPVWIPVDLDPAFANFGGAFATAAYYKDSLMRLWAKGVLVTAAGVAPAATVATLPFGFRPAQTQRKAVEGNGGTAQFISIAPTGICTVELVVAAGGTVDFDFSFLVEQ
jgi:hypothetical protein